jgi:hypothetical protein
LRHGGLEAQNSLVSALGRDRPPGANAARRLQRGTIMSDSSREPQEQVEVWRFRRLDVRSGQYVTSFGKAEVGTIERFGAEAIAGSMESVPHHKLDGNGIYTPPTATLSPVARRRLERLREQYVGLLAEEDHARLEGWADRAELLSMIVQQIDEKMALGTSSL